VIVVVYFLSVFVSLLLASESELADVSVSNEQHGKCGRDCAYYISNRLGVRASLKEIDEKLDKRAYVSMLQLQDIFLEMKLSCKSYKITNKHFALLGLISEEKDTYLLCAFPTNNSLIRHFVVVNGYNSRGIEVYDPSTNNIRFFNIQATQNKLHELPVLVVSKKEIKFLWTKVMIRRFWDSCYVPLIFFTLSFVFFVQTYRNKCKRIEIVHQQYVHLISLFSYITKKYRLLLGFLVVSFIIVISLLFIRKQINSVPILINPQRLDIGEILIGTTKKFSLTVKNVTNSPVKIGKVKTSCSCLTALDKPNVVSVGQSVSIEFTITSVIPGDNFYQIIIEPIIDNHSFLVTSEIVFKGIRKARILPAKHVLANFSKGITSSTVLAYRFSDSPNNPFVLEKVLMAHPESHLQVSCQVPLEINDTDTFDVKIAFDGQSHCGRWSDVILFYGKDKNSSEQLIFATEITGCVVCEECRKSFGFSLLSEEMSER
jgi:hypothetical protein